MQKCVLYGMCAQEDHHWSSDEFWDSFTKGAASEHEQYEFSTISIVHRKKKFSLSGILPRWAENSEEDAHEFLTGVVERIEETSIRWKTIKTKTCTDYIYY